MSKRINKKTSLILQIISILLYSGQLLYSDSYYINYLLIMIVSVICCLINYKSNRNQPSFNKHSFYDWMLVLFSSLFSLMITLSNYNTFLFRGFPEWTGVKFRFLCSMLLILLLLICGFLVFYNIFTAIFYNINHILWHEGNTYQKPVVVFFISFLLLVSSRCFLLFLCHYPGILTADSIDQMNQILTGEYTNHHPFYHTMTIKLFYQIGMCLFGDINDAVATFSVFQIIFIALVFSVSLSTMVWMKIPKWIINLVFIFYFLAPYHIIFAITMWKDVMYGGFVLLFFVSFYRIMFHYGNNLINYFILLCSGLGNCLYRSNGFFVFVLLTLIFVLLWKKKENKILFSCISIILLGFLLKHTLLSQLNVSQPDITESLSIPLQQISRVIYDGYELDDWENKMISEVIDIDKIPETYISYRSLPIKLLVRKKGNQNIIAEKKWEYLKLYLSIGIKHPVVYVKAWIDQTRGYWNSGYQYSPYGFDLYDSMLLRENTIGIEQTVRNASLRRLFVEYMWMFNKIHALRIFLSIGLFVWLDIILLFISMVRKDKLGIFSALPIILVVLSLLIATPLYAEFRYIYAAFCLLPLVMVIALRPEGILFDKVSQKE